MIACDSGDRPGLQIRCTLHKGVGRFDSDALPCQGVTARKSRSGVRLTRLPGRAGSLPDSEIEGNSETQRDVERRKKVLIRVLMPPGDAPGRRKKSGEPFVGQAGRRRGAPLSG